MSEKLNEVHRLIKEIIDEKKAAEKFEPGKTRINYAGPLFDSTEVNAVIDGLVDGCGNVGLHEGFAGCLMGLLGGSVSSDSSSSPSLSEISVPRLGKRGVAHG